VNPVITAINSVIYSFHFISGTSGNHVLICTHAKTFLAWATAYLRGVNNFRGQKLVGQCLSLQNINKLIYYTKLSARQQGQQKGKDKWESCSYLYSWTDLSCMGYCIFEGYKNFTGAGEKLDGKCLAPQNVRQLKYNQKFTVSLTQTTELGAQVGIMSHGLLILEG